MILGLMGPAGSGKSTVAKYLHDRHCALRFSFADPLKAVAAATLGFSHEQLYGTQAQKEAVDPRYNFSPRWFLQRLGTDGCRAVFGANFWCEQTLRQIARVQPPLAVIEDVRFMNEAHAIRAAGGLIWRLETPDRQSDADATHASEREWELAPFDRRIVANVSPGSMLLFGAVETAIQETPQIIRATQGIHLTVS